MENNFVKKEKLEQKLDKKLSEIKEFTKSFSGYEKIATRMLLTKADIVLTTLSSSYSPMITPYFTGSYSLYT